jgi:hypothetical protein
MYAIDEENVKPIYILNHCLPRYLISLNGLVVY